MATKSQILKFTQRNRCSPNHPVHVDYARCDAKGSPSLCCSVCTTTARKSRHRGQPRYIKFISNRDVIALLEQGVELDVRGL